MDDLRKKYLSLISGALDETTLEELRVQAVGKKGEISSRMRSLGKMTPEERQKAGPALNALKDEVNSALAAKKMAQPSRKGLKVSGWMLLCQAEVLARVQYIQFHRCGMR